MLKSLGYTEENTLMINCTEYLSIRLRDPSFFTYTNNTLLSLINTYLYGTIFKHNKSLPSGLEGVMPHKFYAKSILSSNDLNTSRQF